MFINTLNNFFSKLSRKIPLRLVIIVPFVIEIFAVVGVTGWLSFRNGQKAVDDLASQLRGEITTRIHQHLETHTTMLHRINQINVDAIHLGRLKLEDMHALEHHLWKQIQLFDTVSYVGIGTEQATYVGAQLFDSGVAFVEVSDQSTGGHLKKWETDNFANRTKLKQTLPNYNPRKRAWYLSAVKTGNPVWSQAYFSSRRTTLSVSQPIYNNQGKLLAVTIADVSVFDVSQFLRSLKIGQTGQSFIMERSGFIVGTSASEKPYRKVQTSNQLQNPLKDQNAVLSQTVSQFKQFKAIDSHDAMTRASAHYLTQHFGDLNFIKNKQNLDFIDNGKRHFLQVVPFNDKWGLDWLIVVVVPETDFMEPIEANMYYTILLCLAALMITILVGIFTGQWIIQPLVHLNTTAKALARGQWQQVIEVERQDEVGELANSFSRMTIQLQELFTTLEDKNAELQRLDELKDDFLANTSHELRTPLNGIIGIAGSLIDGSTGQLSPHTCSDLSMIVASGQRLSNLVNDILDFSKQKHEHIELQLKPVDIRKIADIVFRFCQPLVGNKDLQLANAIPNDFPLANADENRVQQILHNLVGNAIKFTERGRIEISAQFISKKAEPGEEKQENRESPSEVQLPTSNNQLLITVSDTGVGIPANKTRQIFESYEQVGDSSTSQNGGTGLGLAVTKQLVALHRGKIRVESTVGVGSRFIFTLPLSEKVDVLADNEGINVLVGAETLPFQGATSTPVPAFDTSITTTSTSQALIPLASENESDTYKILIVDDEPVNIHVLTNYLSPYHYSIIQAASGSQALKILEKGEIPDLILLDVMMPYMTGYEVTQTIRERWEANELPIILITAKNQVADLVMGLEVGANDYLVKPTSKNELIARMKTHLHVKQLHKELEEYSHTLEQKVEERTCKLQDAKKAAEDTLQQLKATQEQLVESAKMAELGNLVAGVAHEINTPVGIGVTAASRLETLTTELTLMYKAGKMKRVDLERYLKSAQQGSELTLKNLTRAAELIHSFKQVAVDQTGEQQRTFVLKNYLHEILTTLRPNFKRTQHQVVIECDEEITLSSYPGIFSQIFTNFLMNSLIHGFKNKPEGQITITAHKSEEVKNELMICYFDNGKGVPANIIKKIFEPFFTTNRQDGGSGLGLNIVYNLVTHKLKGTIQCDSVEGEGISFTILIPMIQV